MRVLFLCTGNSCRSQMAQGLLQSLARSGAIDGDVIARSAGTDPQGLNPLAVEVMAELDIDISDHESEHLDRYVDCPFDQIITVCDRARETCPVLPAGEQHHWSFDDPAAATGTKAERLPAFRRVRDEIAARLRAHFTRETDR